MKCYLCGGKANFQQQKNRYICNTCFCKLFEKRIRKFTRVNKIFKFGENILVIGDINKYLVKNIVDKLPIKLFFKSKVDQEFVKKNKIDKIMIEHTLDDEINEFLLSLFQNKKIKKFGKKYVKLLKVVTDEETIRFAKLKKLKFKPNKKDDSVQNLIEELGKKHQNTKYTLFKNKEELIKRLNKD